MEGILPQVRWSEKERLDRNLRNCKDSKLKLRYLIIVNLVNGRGPTLIAQLLSVSRATVYNVATRFSAAREAGLIDRNRSRP